MTLTEQVNELRAKINLMENYVLQLETIFRAFGLPLDPWLTPLQIAQVLSLDKKRIYDELRRAEHARNTKQRYDLVYGVHYRNDQGPDSSKSVWKINLNKFREVVFLPPDERAVIDYE